jgi:hypothetical protein
MTAINREQRDALYGALIRELSALGDVDKLIRHNRVEETS